MKIYNYLLLSFSLIIFSGCYEKFVEGEVEGVMTSDAYYSDPDLCEQVVNGIYDPLGPENSYTLWYWAVGDVGSDDTEEGGKPPCSDQATMDDFERYNVLSSHSELNEFWGNLYNGISRANGLLYNTTEDLASNDFSLDLIQQFRGEAYFLRAFYYFDLVKIWGAVPAWYEPRGTETFKELSNRRDGDDDEGTLQKKYVLGNVIDDLFNAKDLLPTKAEYAAADAGRATKEAAQALLARALIYYQDYFEEDYSSWPDEYSGSTNFALAAELIDSVIATRGGIDACLSEKYADIFSLSGENGSESVFEIQFIPTSDYYGEGTIRNIYLAPRYYYLRSVVDPDHDSLTATGTKVAYGTEHYYGLNQPRQDLVDQFEIDGDEYDPRLDKIAIEGRNDTMYINAASGIYGWHTIDFNRSNTGYYLRKTLHNNDDWGAKNQNSGLNYMIFRMADVVLLGAECAIELGNTDKATQYVNAVRKRARESKIDHLDDNNSPVYASTASTIPADYSSVTIDEVYLERRLELYGEGHRFYDLVRTDRADDVLGAITENSCGDAISWESHNKVMPIPITQIRLHQGNLTQNSGY